MSGWRDTETLRVNSLAAAFKIDLKKGGKRGMGFVSSFLTQLPHATVFSLMWVNTSAGFAAWRPRRLTTLCSTVPEALEFSGRREAELDSRRALAPVQLAGCNWPASLRLVQEKGA